MNSFGRLFRVSIFGESHGLCAGVCVDGCPPGIPISESDFETDMERRKSGNIGTTPRIEDDKPRIMSGVFNGYTTGAPIMIMIENTNTRSRDYSLFCDIPRPGHADFVSKVKYKGFTDYRGGGHFSGRITAGLVAAGVIAKKVITPAVVSTKILEIGGEPQWDDVIGKCVEEHNSAGGIVQCVVDQVPVGWGEPFFDSAESLIGHIVFAIPAIKGIEFGAGFSAARMFGSGHNDPFIGPQGETGTNHAGGINGGITNGNQICFRVAVKPTSSIAMPQQTMNIRTKEMTILETPGRHDTCITLRMPPVLEAATAIALADFALISKAYS